MEYWLYGIQARTLSLIYAGRLLRELVHSRLPNSAGGISIKDGTLAVPGFSGEKLCLFTIH